MTTVESSVRVTPPAQLDRDNPWPGLESYEESSYGFFSGRADETHELLRRILDEPVTVLFGKSGLGKTSLLKAGVFPRLRERGLLPIFLRLHIRENSGEFIEQVRRALLDELSARTIEHPEIQDDETLWEYLHRANLEFWTKDNRLVRPVFVFDQFEELFTLGAPLPAYVDGFREDLADLAENRIPARLATRLEQRSTNELGLDVQAMPYKLVIALREDFLADLEGWRLTMPSLRRNRMRLLPMGPDQALEAVCNERTSHLVPEALGRRIVAFLSAGTPATDSAPGTELLGPTVEPALLSLFCRGVNEHRKRERKTEFDDALLEGGKDTIVADFYRSSLADQPHRVRCFIEEHLITEHGFRNSYSVEDALGQQAVTVTELDTLVNRHLLRHEHHLGTDRVELTHDLLTKAVLEERDERRRIESGEVERRKRWRRLRAVAIGCVLLVVPLFAWLAVRASRAESAATAESNRSKSRELAAIARSTTDSDPELAMALAMEGLRRADTAEARGALLDAARFVWPSATLSSEDLKGTPQAVSLTDDGSRLAVLAGQTLSMWDVTTRQPKQVWQKALERADSSSVAFSPDQKVIAVGRATSLAVLEAATGELRFELRLSEADDRPVVFSPDGGWLAWRDGTEALALLDVAHPDQPPMTIATGPVIGFSVQAGGTRITTVRNPLGADVFTRQAHGKWTRLNFDLSKCITPQSVSPGGRYLSATWKARKCGYPAEPDQPAIDLHAEGETKDIIWSAGGNAFADLLQSGDVVVGSVGGARELEYRIKGHGISQQSDLTRLISVAESASRFAYIDNDEHKLVKILSLGGYKPFLTSFTSERFAVAPDGRWFAVASAGADGKSGAVDILPMDGSFARDHLPRVRSHITLGGVASQLYASDDTLTVVMATSPVTTVLYDIASGQPRLPPYASSAQMVGSTGELLLLGPSETDGWRIIKTADGSQLAAWNDAQMAVLSPRGTAVAILPKGTASGQRQNTAVYSISGTAVTKAGETAGLASALDVVVADDAQTITQGSTVYKVSAAAPDTPVPESTPDRVPPSVSPMGGFELQFEPADAARGETMTLIRRSDKTVVKRFATRLDHLFSTDDRWLATWGAPGMQIIDLAGATTALSQDYADVVRVRFVAQNAMLSVERASDTMLVPLDRGLMERFATWLTPRVLTSKERCLYGLAAEDCR